MIIELRSHVEDDAAVLFCRGAISANESGKIFRAGVADLLRHNPTVIVDLSEIDYIDSSGLGILVGLYSTARTTKSTLKYRNLSASVDYRQSFDASASSSTAPEERSQRTGQLASA